MCVLFFLQQLREDGDRKFRILLIGKASDLPDDIIVSIEDINMTSDDAVKRMQEKYAPGDRVKAHIYRPATVENGLEEPEEFDIEFDLAEFKD